MMGSNSTKPPAAPENLSFGFVTIQPTFTILDKAKATPIMKRFVEATKTEKGCIYYGWTVSGDKLFCREAYLNGEAANAHLKNVGSLIGEILADGVRAACRTRRARQERAGRVATFIRKVLDGPASVPQQTFDDIKDDKMWIDFVKQTTAYDVQHAKHALSIAGMWKLLKTSATITPTNDLSQSLTNALSTRPTAANWDSCSLGSELHLQLCKVCNKLESMIGRQTAMWLEAVLGLNTTI